MTNDSERARRARVQRLISRSRGKVVTASELFRRHGLPATVEQIDRGEKPGMKTQLPLFYMIPHAYTTRSSGSFAAA